MTMRTIIVALAGTAASSLRESTLILIPVYPSVKDPPTARGASAALAVAGVVSTRRDG